MTKIGVAGVLAALLLLGGCAKWETGFLFFDNNCSGDGYTEPGYCERYTSGG